MTNPETHPREAEAQAAFDLWWNSKPPRIGTLEAFMAGYASALLAVEPPAEPEFKCKWPGCSCDTNKCRAYNL